MITDTFTINVHARVVMYMSVYQGIKVWHASMLTVALTGAADMFVNWYARHSRKSKVL